MHLSCCGPPMPGHNKGFIFSLNPSPWQGYVFNSDHYSTRYVFSCCWTYLMTHILKSLLFNFTPCFTQIFVHSKSPLQLAFDRDQFAT